MENKRLKSFVTRKGEIILVDDDIYELYKNNTMYLKYGYPTFITRVNGKKINNVLSRVIMQPNRDMVVDHIDGNKLDNRRSNLRICTQRQNCYNSKVQKTNPTKYKGVQFRKDKKILKYRARIVLYKKQYHLGYFSTAKEAAIAYNIKAQEFFGIYAKLNKIDDES